MHAHNAYGEGYVFRVSVLPFTGGGEGGGSGQMHYLANVPGIEHAHSGYKSAHACVCVGGGGGSGQMHYLANVPGIEHILAIKVLMPGGRSRQMHYLANVPKKCSCHACWLYKHHALLLTCYQSAHLLSKGSTEGLHLLI